MAPKPKKTASWVKCIPLCKNDKARDRLVLSIGNDDDQADQAFKNEDGRRFAGRDETSRSHRLQRPDKLD